MWSTARAQWQVNANSWSVGSAYRQRQRASGCPAVLKLSPPRFLCRDLLFVVRTNEVACTTLNGLTPQRILLSHSFFNISLLSTYSRHVTVGAFPTFLEPAFVQGLSHCIHSSSAPSLHARVSGGPPPACAHCWCNRRLCSFRCRQRGVVSLLLRLLKPPPLTRRFSPCRVSGAAKRLALLGARERKPALLLPGYLCARHW